MAWHNPSWLNRKKVTIDATKIPGDLTDHVALVPLLDADIQTGTQVGANDVLFTSGDGITKIPHVTQKRHLVENDGVWSWFSNPRAIYHSGIFEKTYWVSITSIGDIQISSYNHANGKIDRFTLDTSLELDDHDHGCIYVRTDGKIVVAWGRHNVDQYHYCRVSTNAEDISAWGTKTTITLTGTVTYQNLIYLESNSTLYLFYRHKTGGNHSWRYITSLDEGSTWSATENEFYVTGTDQPYCIFAKNGTSRIDVTATNSHPTHVPTPASVYHFYIEDSTGIKYRKSDATDITSSVPLGPTDITQVYDGTTEESWIYDIAIDSSGNPAILFPRYPTTTDHRYYISKWSGTAWSTPTQITTGGTYLYSAEPHYSGLVNFDRSDTTLSTVFLSKESGGVWEIQEWTDSDGWSKTADITSGSSSALRQARPVSPWNQPADKRMSVLWWSGAYTTYVSYSTGIYCYPPLISGANVNVPSVSGTVDTDLYVYYNNAAATDQSNLAGTMADYDMSQALEIPPGKLFLEDITGNDYDATLSAFSTLDRADTDGDPNGILPYSVGFNRTLSLNAALNYNMANKAEFTIEAIIKWDGTGSNKHTIFSNWNATQATAKVLLRLDAATNYLQGYVITATDTQVGGAYAVAVNTTNYHYVALAFDATDLRIHLDGGEGSVGATGAVMAAGTSGVANIANTPHTAVDDFGGEIVMLRVSNKKLSADARTAQFNGLLDAANYYTFGTEEDFTATEIPLSGDSASESKTTGTASFTIPVVGISASIATANAAITTSVPFAGSMASITVIDGYLSLSVGMQGSMLADAVAAALLSSNSPLYGSAGSVADADAALSVGSGFSGSALSQALAGGGLGLSFNFDGAALSDAMASAVLSLGSSVDLSGDMAAEASASSSALQMNIPMTGAAVSAADVDGLITTIVPLAGGGASVTAMLGSLDIGIGFAGNANAEAIANSILKFKINLSADAVAQASASGLLSGAGDLTSDARYTSKHKPRAWVSGFN